MKKFVIIGSINMALVVALGAFGAHGLEGKIAEKLMGYWQTAVEYHMAHALGLIVLGLFASKFTTIPSLLKTACWLLLIGIILFSGSLYIMALTEAKLGLITPTGGVAFVVGWILAAIAAGKYKTN